ncbi:DUF3035 domain-containing protein [Hyphomonas sp.]|jgi:hypothetical protein|uniref:DUF3035 domain-containing protein n=1 Tax=Hyphomonas sp. TaxID=87 RepID=UPI003566F589
MMKPVLLIAAGAALALISACSSGGGTRTPDEFRVVTKAPLIIPPEYALRPPPAGGSLPAEVDPNRTEVATAFGTTVGKDASKSERALVALAGANAVNPMVRSQVDYDETKTIRKSSGVVDTLLFWRKENPEDLEAARADNATGGGDVVIEKASGSARLKLPGT